MPVRNSTYSEVRASHGGDDDGGGVLNGDFVGLGDGENDGFRLIVVAQNPHYQTTKVDGIDKLPQRRARAQHQQRLTRLCRKEKTGNREKRLITKTAESEWRLTLRCRQR